MALLGTAFVKADCTPLRDGQTVSVGSLRTTLRADYLLKREGDNYIITLYPKLVNEAGEPLTNQNEEAFLNQYNKCSGFIGEVRTTGDKYSGSSIKIRYTKPSQRPPDVQATTITIFNSKASRSARSNKWPNDITCEVQIHETFHLLGLVDLYDEAQQRKHGEDIPSYSCRAKATAPSLMSDQNFLNLTLPTLLPIACECKTSSCRAKLDSLNGINDCQKIGGSITKLAPLDSIAAFNNRQSIEDYFGKIGQWLRTGDWYSRALILQEPRMNWHIYPAEFHLLVNPSPDCNKDNEKYITCSANAYRNPTTEGGTGCLQVPNYCSNPSSWLNNFATPSQLSNFTDVRNE